MRTEKVDRANVETNPTLRTSIKCLPRVKSIKSECFTDRYRMFKKRELRRIPLRIVDARKIYIIATMNNH